MSYQTERDEFIARASREGLPFDVIRALLRYSSTLTRLAVASCNGDWPADNGERKTRVCEFCECGWVPSSFKTVREHDHSLTLCPDCRASFHVKRLLESTDYKAIIGGDPRGAVLRIVKRDIPDADIDSGRERGIYVPGRER